MFEYYFFLSRIEALGVSAVKFRSYKIRFDTFCCIRLEFYGYFRLDFLGWRNGNIKSLIFLGRYRVGASCFRNRSGTTYCRYPVSTTALRFFYSRAPEELH